MNMSHAELAKLLFVTPKQVSRFENGSAKPSIGVVKRMADIFHVDFRHLIPPVETPYNENYEFNPDPSYDAAIKMAIEEEAMRIIAIYYRGKKNGAQMLQSEVVGLGLPQEQLEDILVCLASGGYIQLDATWFEGNKALRLTEKGRCYYRETEKEKAAMRAAEDAEKQAQQQQENRQRRQFRHDWFIAISSAMLGALLSAPVWKLIEYFTIR